MSKNEFLQVLDELSEIVLRAEASRVTAPTTVTCGSKDKPNLSAAKLVQQLVPHAELEIVPGVGHQWQIAEPQLFAEHLRAHLRRVDELDT